MRLYLKNLPQTELNLHTLLSILKEMMASLEAKVEANQKKMDDGQEQMKAQMASFASRIEDNNEKFEVLRDALVSRTDALQERIMACLRKTEAKDLEKSPEEKESVAEHQEVAKGHAAVKPVG
jgi:peptidoglycan hydrolase CwlO-like protein